jgi:formylglycine-generating enzyme required for sulfatase activity
MNHRVPVSLLTLLMGGLLVAAGPESTSRPSPPSRKPKAQRVTVITNAIGMKLALIPPGRFLMGSPATEKERQDNEFQHEVAITSPFYMGVYTVTQREYEKLMGKAWANGQYNKWGSDAFFSAAHGGGPDHPMENLKWYQAVEFCTRLSGLPDEKRAGRTYRLPTEAEWEYACRAGTKTTFYFGDALSSRDANFNGNYPYGGAAKGPYLRKTAKVGSFKPNAFGLYDMHGNVWQWCADWYDPRFYRKSIKEDPQGPFAGVVKTGYNDFYRVIRGGSWLDESRACRAAYRFRAMPHDAYRIVGFRVACNADGKGAAH